MEVQVPLRQEGLVAVSPGVLRLAEDIETPQIETDEILVKVEAVALNPSDWKTIDISCTPGAVSGGDFAGIIVKIGRHVQKSFNVGDRVCSVVFGANPARPKNGAFAEYVAAVGDLCFRVPESISPAIASSFGAGVMSVGLAFRSLGLDVSGSQNFESPGPFVLIYGGSTSTGTLAIQMLRHLGYTPITTCSPHNFALVESRGAVMAFDYKSSTCREEIRELTGMELRYAMDCIVTSKSTTICYGSIGRNGGKYTALESFPNRLSLRRKNVKPEWILAWSIFGKTIELGGDYRRDVRPEDRKFAVEWTKKIESLLENGELLPHPVQVHRGGLAEIPTGLETLRNGKVSGVKYVYTI
ncbi:hypothetical protein G7Y89_g1215 [Cudoniella acicularis]|uniref:Enoyl reductase (ER) domain-containing protein n=1 Tax=Cudoniella acicularis TaxID=354080 RepID=A0A8H4RXQ3_9HELO|nr:hypothetical protein G7Y89_g1215 [Cudoniella acicularis]